jgi:hypothetical protein
VREVRQDSERAATLMRIEMVIDGDSWNGYGWTVYKDGTQYASEIYLSNTAREAFEFACIYVEELI